MRPPHAAIADLMARRRLTLIAGPCVVESRALCLTLAAELKAMCARHGVGLIFKASFDKANRTSAGSFRGHGMAFGLEVLAEVRAETGLPVLTDIHLPDHAATVAETVDMLQIPAFLCRQTDLLAAAAATGLPTNLKKGQFLAPEDLQHAAAKFRAQGGGPLAVTERGVSFGYHTLVVDMRGLVVLRETCRAPVVFDATHSVQAPSAGDGASGGDRRMAPPLARAAAAVGIDGLFCEVHPEPDRALSDGPNALTPAMLDDLLGDVVALHTQVARHRLLPAEPAPQADRTLKGAHGAP